MRRLSLAFLLLLPSIAAAELPPPGSAIPADAAWALVAPEAGPAAAAAATIGRLADTRGLQQGFAAGLRTGVGYDPFDADALRAAGVDATQPLAVASHQGVELASVHLLPDDEKGTAHLGQWLQAIGETSAAPATGGWQLQLARKGDRPVAGFARNGNRVVTARLVDPKGDLRRTLHRAIDAAGGKSSLARAPLFRSVRDEVRAPWYLWVARDDTTIASGLAVEGARLQANGRAHVTRADGLLGKRAAYPAATAGQDLLLARIFLAPTARDEVEGGVRFLLAQACPTCPATARAAEAKALASLLAGPAVLGVSRLDPAALRAERLEPAAAPFAWIAQVKDRAAAKRWLDGVAKRLGAGEGADRSVDSALGRLHFGLHDDRLYVASDAALRDRLLEATTGAAAGPGEPLQATMLPARAGEALSALSVTDALRGGQAAALFALRLQLGPLLRDSGPLELRAEPVGKDTFRFRAGWDLRAAR